MKSKPTMSRNQYEVNIDFDEARKAWRANKRREGASFRYCCGLLTKNGKPCKGYPKHWKKSLHSKNEPFIRTWGLCRYHG